jgi:hypothetical protein
MSATLRRHISSNSPMRSAGAVLSSILLVMTVSACAFAACAPASDSTHSCCHKHRSGGVPCAPATEMRQCAHALLERGKPAPAGPLAIAPLAPLSWAPASNTHLATAAPRLADSSGLFLKIHVLLI